MSEKHASGLTKAAVYGWTIKDSPGDLVWVPKTELQVDHQYQRALIDSKVLSICKEWSWVSCGALTVARRENGLFVVEGQHRLAAAMKRFDIVKLPCVVFEVESIKQEAQGFLDANTKRKAVTVLDKHLAGLVAGNPRAAKLDGFFNLVGFVPVSPYGGTGQGGTIRCIAAASTVMESMPEKKFVQMLRICYKLSVAEDTPIDSSVLRGLGYLYANWKGEIPQKLEDRILAKGMEQLKLASNKAAVFFGLTGERVWGEGMLTEINKGLKQKFQL